MSYTVNKRQGVYIMKKTYKNLVHIIPQGKKDKINQAIHTKQGKSRVVHNLQVKDSIEKNLFLYIENKKKIFTYQVKSLLKKSYNRQLFFKNINTEKKQKLTKDEKRKIKANLLAELKRLNYIIVKE